MTVFWAYLFAAQFLTIWFGNLPDETEFLLRRMQGVWGWTGLLALALVFAGPFATMLHPVGRSSPRILGAVLVGQLVGLWLVCQILVVPTLSAGDTLLPVHPRTLLVALGLLGAFVLSVAPALKQPGAVHASGTPAAQAERRRS